MYTSRTFTASPRSTVPRSRPIPAMTTPAGFLRSPDGCWITAPEMTIRAAVALADVPRIRERVRENPAVLHELISTQGGLLSIAVNHGHVQIVSLLLDLGADVDERITLNELEEPTPSWGMPLWYAALGRTADIANSCSIAARILTPMSMPPAGRSATPGDRRMTLFRSGGCCSHTRRNRLSLYGRRDLVTPLKPGGCWTPDRAEALASELVEAAANSGCPSIVEMALPRRAWRSTTRSGTGF